MSTKTTPTETAVAKKPACLVHTRDANDSKAFADNFDVSTIAGKTQHIEGLTAESQLSLIKAVGAGKRIITTGLPVDIAAMCGTVTVIRVWDRAKADGTRTRGCQPPKTYFVKGVKDEAALATLRSTPEYIAAFGSESDDEDEPEGSEEASV